MVVLKSSEWSSATPLTLREPVVFNVVSLTHRIMGGNGRTDDGEVSHADLLGETFLDQRHATKSVPVIRELLLNGL
jgi:hypothetical protein